MRFCRLSVYNKQLHSIGFDAIRSAYLNPPGSDAPWKTFWEPAVFWEKFPGSIPVVMRHPVFFFSILKVAARDFIETWLRQNRFGQSMQRGDMIVSIGAGWGIPGYIEHIAELKRRYGIRFSILLHDLIPIQYQSLVEPRHTVQFRSWLRDAIAVADVVFTNSKYTRTALIEFASESGWRLPCVEALQLGSGLADRPAAKGQATTSLPARYVLFVSTIEARKIIGCLLEYGNDCCSGTALTSFRA